MNSSGRIKQIVDNSLAGRNEVKFYTKRILRRAAFLVLASGLLNGCAGGSRVQLSDAALAGNPSAMWEDGQKSADTGEALVSKGEQRLATGRRQVLEGQEKIAAANLRVAQAREDYQSAVAATGGSSAPTDLQAEAKRLKAIGKRWEEAIDAVREGNNLVEKGNKNLDKGQSEIREGRSLMESGSTLMRNAQRTRMGDDLLPVKTEGL